MAIMTRYPKHRVYPPLAAGCPHRGRPRVCSAVPVCLTGILLLGIAVSTQGAESGPAPDVQAARFVDQCATCHTIGGGKSTAADLATVAQQPIADLKDSIEIMKDNVTGTVDVVAMAEFLKAPDAAQRVKQESARRGAVPAVKATPGDPAVGRRLFSGTVRLLNGGVSCAGCHMAADTASTGGTLGPTLAGVSRKYDPPRLKAACEQTPFKMMKPIYRNRPVTPTEAAHIAAYLAQADAGAASAESEDRPFLALSALGSLLALGIAGLLYRKRLAPAGKLARE